MNPTKNYSVTPKERKEMLEVIVKKLKLKNVSVHIWRFAHTVGTKYLARGIRTLKKDFMEEKLLELLNVIGPVLLAGLLPFKTIYVKCDPQYAHISSTKIRNSIRDGKSIEEFVDPC